MGWHLVLHLDAGSILAFEALLRSLRLTSSSTIWAACRCRRGWTTLLPHPARPAEAAELVGEGLGRRAHLGGRPAFRMPSPSRGG